MKERNNELMIFNLPIFSLDWFVDGYKIKGLSQRVNNVRYYENITHSLF